MNTENKLINDKICQRSNVPFPALNALTFIPNMPAIKVKGNIIEPMILKVVITSVNCAFDSDNLIDTWVR